MSSTGIRAGTWMRRSSAVSSTLLYLPDQDICVKGMWDKINEKLNYRSSFWLYAYPA